MQKKRSLFRAKNQTRLGISHFRQESFVAVHGQKTTPFSRFVVITSITDDEQSFLNNSMSSHKELLGKCAPKNPLMCRLGPTKIKDSQWSLWVTSYTLLAESFKKLCLQSINTILLQTDPFTGRRFLTARSEASLRHCFVTYSFGRVWFFARNKEPFLLLLRLRRSGLLVLLPEEKNDYFE